VDHNIPGPQSHFHRGLGKATFSERESRKEKIWRGNRGFVRVSRQKGNLPVREGLFTERPRGMQTNGFRGTPGPSTCCRQEGRGCGDLLNNRRQLRIGGTRPKKGTGGRVTWFLESSLAPEDGEKKAQPWLAPENESPRGKGTERGAKGRDDS